MQKEEGKWHYYTRDTKNQKQCSLSLISVFISFFSFSQQLLESSQIRKGKWGFSATKFDVVYIMIDSI